MPNLPITTGVYGRPRLGLPYVRLVNAFLEQSKGGPTPDIRVPRPGLTSAFTLPTAPIQRFSQQPGLFGGDLFTVAATAAYRNATALGEVAYGNSARMASANGQLAIVAGGALYCYDGGALVPITAFDDGVSSLPPFSGVSVLYNIFIYPVAGTDQFFFSSVGDPRTINAANFGFAQTDPDPIVETAVLGEEIYFFGGETVEIWDFQGQLTAPFAISQGRTYAKGCASQDSVAKLDNALFWVGDDLVVYRTSAVPLRVSSELIEDRLQACPNPDIITAFPLAIEGHVFYVLNLVGLDETYAYDCQTKEWSQWGSDVNLPEPGLYQGATAAGRGQQIFIGDHTTGDIYLLDPTNNTDNGQARRVVVSGALWRSGGNMRVDAVSLACVRGVGTPEVPDPIVEMRYSGDGGRTWSSWLQASLGMQGQYYYKANWWGLGLLDQPGYLFEFAVSDAVYFTVEGASYNEGRP